MRYANPNTELMVPKSISNPNTKTSSVANGSPLSKASILMTFLLWTVKCSPK